MYSTRASNDVGCFSRTKQFLPGSMSLYNNKMTIRNICNVKQLELTDVLGADWAAITSNTSSPPTLKTLMSSLSLVSAPFLAMKHLVQGSSLPETNLTRVPI